MEIKELESSEGTLVNSLEKFESELHNWNEELDAVPDSEKLKRAILNNFSELANIYISISNKEFEYLSPENSQQQYLFNYALAKPFKDLMLLHRDVLLQLQIASQKLKEKIVSSESVISHFDASKDILLNSIREFKLAIEQEHRTISRYEKSGKDISRKIKHHKNPWEVYKEQFQDILEQIQLIETTGVIFHKVIKVFSSIRMYTTRSYEQGLKESYASETSVKKIQTLLEELNEIEELPKLIKEIDLEINKIEPDGLKLISFSNHIEENLKSLTNLNFPISTNQGLLLIKKIDFNKSVKKWLDYELLPNLIELWDNQNNLNSYVKHSLINLRSSLKLLKDDKSLSPLHSQLNTLNSILHTVSASLNKQRLIINEIENKLQQQLLATNIYKSDEFLEVSFQSSFNQYASGSSSLLFKLFDKIKSTYNNLNSTYENSHSSDSDNSIEKSISCINYRMVKEENAQYDTLFLNKNFIGDLFLVPRIKEDTKLEACFNEWKKGFNKAVLISGNNLSGKSTFMEDFAKKHFGRDIIFLEVDSTITIEGRKFKTSRNLKEALQEVRKNIYTTRPVLIIDDLEYWRSDDSSLLNNIRALVHFVLSESDRIFVMASTSKAMKKHLDQRLPFSNAFTTQIDLNKTNVQEIYKAVLIRHGASHKKMVNKKGAELTSKQIEHHINDLAHTFNFNIGEVLQAWAYSTKIDQKNLVVIEETTCNFEDFFTLEELIILKYVYLYKFINEVLLKNFLGKRYSLKYDSGIKRLINTKVLLRNPDGNLILNRVITSDIYEILKYRGTLK